MSEHEQIAELLRLAHENNGLLQEVVKWLAISNILATVGRLLEIAIFVKLWRGNRFMRLLLGGYRRGDTSYAGGYDSPPGGEAARP